MSFKSEAVKPLTEVADFTGSRLSRPPIVTIHFRRPTVAGARVVFIPKRRGFALSPHPVIPQLRALCDRAGNQREVATINLASPELKGRF